MWMILVTRYTYLGSTLAVASSKIKILLFRRMARARHTNCLCPTERLDPPSLILLSRPSTRSCTTDDKWACNNWLRYFKKTILIGFHLYCKNLRRSSYLPIRLLHASWLWLMTWLELGLGNKNPNYLFQSWPYIRLLVLIKRVQIFA